MSTIDTAARADLAATKVQIHRMVTGLQLSIGALDLAFKAVERAVEGLGEAADAIDPDQRREISETLREARAQILNTRLYYMPRGTGPHS